MLQAAAKSQTSAQVHNLGRTFLVYAVYMLWQYNDQTYNIIYIYSDTFKLDGGGEING